MTLMTTLRCSPKLGSWAFPADGDFDSCMFVWEFSLGCHIPSKDSFSPGENKARSALSGWVMTTS